MKKVVTGLVISMFVGLSTAKATVLQSGLGKAMELPSFTCVAMLENESNYRKLRQAKVHLKKFVIAESEKQAVALFIANNMQLLDSKTIVVNSEQSTLDNVDVISIKCVETTM